MEKKITVYVVTSADSSVTFGTKSQANKAVELLNQFGYVAEITQEKKTVSLA